MEINNSNITEFITFLYKKNFNQSPPEEILASWQDLEVEDIPFYIDELFTSWNFSKEAGEEMIQEFVAKNKKVVPPFIPTPAPKPEPIVTQPPPTQGSNQAYQQSNQTYQKVNHTNVTPIKNTRVYKQIFSLSLVLFATFLLNFVLSKYKKFNEMNYIYVITDNVSIRDYDGNVVGRMDMFPDKTSFALLRLMDNGTYDIKVGDQRYPCKKVLLDSIQFSDYLFNNKAAFAYVNENYVTDNKEEFQLFRTVFKEINNNAKEKNALNINHRKVIIGSLNHNPDLLGTYVLNTCNSNNKDFSSILKMQQKDGDLYVIVAKMSDGQYYQFVGNTATSTYEDPKKVQIKVPYKNEFSNLKTEDLIFKNNDANHYLYKCNGTNTNYMAVLNEVGTINYFKWASDQN